MGKIAVALLLAFAVTLAIVVGNRMSADAMAVVVGVVCGVAAGIPMSMLLMLAMRRKERQPDEPAYGQLSGRYASSPPVVVIQGGTPVSGTLPPPYFAMRSAIQEPGRRQFRIIGEGED